MLTEILERSIAPWILRILLNVGASLSSELLSQKLTAKLAKQDKQPPTEDDVKKEVEFLVAAKLIEIFDNKYRLTEAGKETAKELIPEAARRP